MNTNTKISDRIRIEIEDLMALKQLGMRCLVMTNHGTAFANQFMLTLNDSETGWKQDNGHNPFASSLRPQKLDRYCDDWKTSLIDIDRFLENQETRPDTDQNR